MQRRGTEMRSNASPRLALSTWSIHRAIGITWPNSPQSDADGPSEETWGPGTLSLMEVPARLAQLGIRRLEVCSFQIAGRDRGFLGELRSAIAESGITFQTLLIDDGDITDPVHARRDIGWIGRWIDIAAELGAEKARVIAGKRPPSPEVLDRTVAGLAELAERGVDQGVRILTENWLATMAGPDEVNAVLDRLDGKVGFLADLGNWKGPAKYDDLATVLPRAENSHVHCNFTEDLEMDADDFGRCLDVACGAGYAGPYTLIYNGPNADEWQAVEMERDFIRQHLPA
jgi:sugar phosphate isomerase/epimerase